MPPNFEDSFLPAPAWVQFGSSDPGVVVMHDNDVTGLPATAYVMVTQYAAPNVQTCKLPASQLAVSLEISYREHNVLTFCYPLLRSCKISVFVVDVNDDTVAIESRLILGEGQFGTSPCSRNSLIWLLNFQKKIALHNRIVRERGNICFIAMRLS